jgi:hypothetical protein
VALSRQRIIHYFIEKGFKINRDRILAHKRIISAVRRVQFVSDRMSCVCVCVYIYIYIYRLLVNHYYSKCARAM